MFVAFCRMVEHNVKNYFKTGFVHFAHHRLEFSNLTACFFRSGIRSFWRKKSYSAVAPIILEPLTVFRIYVRVFVSVKFVDRQKLYACNAEFF